MTTINVIKFLQSHRRNERTDKDQVKLEKYKTKQKTLTYEHSTNDPASEQNLVNQ